MVYVNVLEEAMKNNQRAFHERHAYRESFTKMLEQFVPKPPVVERIVDLGCGIARAAYSLQHYFHSKSWLDIEYVGIDRDEHKIAFTNTMYSYLKGFTFIVGNAEHVEDDFDLATILNPNIAEFQNGWNNVIRNIRNKSKLLIATALQPSEHRMLEEAISKAGYHIQTSAENPHAEPKELKLGLDKYIIIAHS